MAAQRLARLVVQAEFALNRIATPQRKRRSRTAAGNLAKEYWPTIFRGLQITKTAPSGGTSRPLPPG